MPFRGSLPAGLVHRVNRCALALQRSSRCARRHLTVLTYTGPRSGREFSIPVGYRRTGDTVRIVVQLPDSKRWWRNFTGAGHRLSLRLDGVDRPGHGVAHRDGSRVLVTVRLD